MFIYYIVYATLTYLFNFLTDIFKFLTLGSLEPRFNPRFLVVCQKLANHVLKWQQTLTEMAEFSFPGSTAATAGLEKGDCIVKIDGVNVSRSTADSIARIFR